ncbi:tyrosine-type recombinase/integrase [Chloroflexota bacterium]
MLGGPLAQLAEQLTLNTPNYTRLVSTFLESRREGLSPRTIEFYVKFLTKAKTRLPRNPHTFRRTFTSRLAKKGVDSLHIMRLGRWESLEMVQRYTRSVSFQDSLKFYSMATH